MPASPTCGARSTATRRTTPPSPRILVPIAEEYIARTKAVAPRWFGRLPSDRCTVRPVEPHQEQDAPPAFYSRLPRTGRTGATTSTPSARPRPLHRLAATTFHEATPGHHFQIALEAELPGLPTFRRFGSRLAGGAYVEGWGLYAEASRTRWASTRTPGSDSAMLESEAWRAVRLVVDTGIHAFRWTRQQSIDLLRARAGLSASSRPRPRPIATSAGPARRSPT